MKIVDGFKGFLRAVLPGKSFVQIIGLRGGNRQIQMNPETAFNYAAFFSGVRAYTDAIAPLPWHVFRRRSDGGRERIEDGVDKLLHVRPNREMSAMAWREVMLQWALSWGNGYSEIERNFLGEPIALWPIHPSRVIPRRTDGGELYYDIYGEGGQIAQIPAIDMFHLAGMGYDGVVGYSVILLAAGTIGLGLSQETFGTNFFKQGTHFGGVIEFPGKMNQEAQANFRKSIEAVHRGEENAWRIFVLEQGAKFVSTGVPPEAAQFLELREFQIVEIARWLRLPPHKLMDLTRATFSNIEEQKLEFVEALTPWTVKLEQEANWKLFGRNRRANHFTRINLNALLRGNTESRAKFYQMLLDRGIFSVNDVLELEDRNPIGPDGDKRFVPLNMTLLENAGEEPVQPDIPGGPSGSAAPQDEDGQMALPRPIRQGSAQLRMLEEVLGRIARREKLLVSDAAKKYRDDETAFTEWLQLFAVESRSYLDSRLRVPLEAVSEWCADGAEVNGAIDGLCRHFLDNHLASMQHFVLSAYRAGTVQESMEFRTQNVPKDSASQLVEQVTRVVLFEMRRETDGEK
jgi:HK97 family phage portal protein